MSMAQGQDGSIKALAEKWLRLDRDPATRKEIEDLIRQNDTSELEKRLRKRIAFGTAGLRAAMKAGFAYMNSLTVLQASHGLAKYILYTRVPPAVEQFHQHKVVIGYDARHNSEHFARLAAHAFLGRGFEVLWFGKLVHTPLVPFAVKHYTADAGVMVTASHNPKNDNGYKVYWSNGCQIIPPHDVGIAAGIDIIDEVETWDPTEVDRNPKTTNIHEQVVHDYLETICNLEYVYGNGDKMPEFVYTPMHGVGLEYFEQVISLCTGEGVLNRRHHMYEDDDGNILYDGPANVVPEQAEPNPDFPTVSFPNPEEKGALSVAKKYAEKQDVALIIANDPDADRFAAAERRKNGLIQYGPWHQFTGNQIGILLASYIFETHNGNKSKIAMLASTVSSRMLAKMAAVDGFHFQETLTGFKWLGNVAQDLRIKGYEPVFAYEEAIGYMFPSVVWDKDGITAAIVFLKACALWYHQDFSAYGKLQALYEKYGYFVDVNTYLISPSPEVTNKIFDDIRHSNNGSRPDYLGRLPIRRWRDLTTGYDSGTPDQKPVLPVDASAQMITCELSENVVFTVRGSGTEPKIKLYIEAEAETEEAARSRAKSVLQDLTKEWFKPQYGLKEAPTGDELE